MAPHAQTGHNGAGGGTSDVVVGAAAGYSYDALELWILSLLDSGFRGHKMLICRRVPGATMAKVRSHGITVVDVDSLARRSWPRVHTNDDMSVDRFYFIWHALRGYPVGSHRYLVLTDVRDVVFQDDPSLWLERALGDRDIVIGSEGIALSKEAWNDQALRKAFNPGIYEMARDRPAYNAGVIGGRFEVVRDLALQVFLTAPGSRVQYSDQPALNVLLALSPYRDRTLFASHADAWACHAGVTADPNVLERHRDNLIEPEPTLSEDGSVRNQDGTRFAIVHQYDRVPAWDEAFKARWRTPGLHRSEANRRGARRAARIVARFQRPIVRIRRKVLR